MTSERNDPISESGDMTRPKRPSGSAIAEMIWYLVLSLVALFVLVSAGIVAASVSPRFCLTCHSSANAQLENSVHANIECNACHAPTAPLGLVENRMNIVSMVYSAPFVAFRPSVTDPMVENDSCLLCHKAMISQTVVGNGIQMNHAAPEKNGWSCVTCHSGASHPQGARNGSTYSMDMCLQCHGASTDNLTTCESCHIEGDEADDATVGMTPWRVTHGVNWQQTHGMGDLNTCKTCHSEDYCAACHNMPLPHAQTFLSTHGQDVLSRDNGDEDCLVCHKGSACENCHGLEMPHPDNFAKEHSVIAKKDSEVCARCHTEKQCEDCHTRHTHPGIPPDQLKLLKKNPVTSQ